MASRNSEQVKQDIVKQFEKRTPKSKKLFMESLKYMPGGGTRNIAYYHSAHRNIPSLRKLYPEPTVDINPATAESLSIKDGDWVQIETKRGSIKSKARFFDGVHPKVVHISHGWWYSYEPEWKSVNVNILTDNSCLDSIIGSESLKALLCRVRSLPEGN